MESTRRNETATASPACVAAAAGNLAERALDDVWNMPQPRIDPRKQERVATIKVTVGLEVRDK